MITRDPDGFEGALSRRLAQLSAMPVDTGALEARVRAEVGSGAGGRARHFRLVRSVLGIAASLIVVALILGMLQSRPAQASDAALMMQLHRDIVSGKVPTMQVDSVDDVNKAFAAFGQSGVQLSAPPEMNVMACCMKDVGNKQVACILLNDDKIPVTLTVAGIEGLKPLDSPAVAHQGETFHVVQSADLTMVSVDRGQHRICLIGALGADRLMTLADKLKF